MDEVDVLSVGKTNYYSVRKGPHNYRVAEGKKFDDMEHCWQMKRDGEGRTFYVNMAGERRWKLPDINLTEAERKLQELKRLEAKQAKAAKLATGQTMSKPADQPTEQDRKAMDFVTRDRAALSLKPNPEFVDAAKRKPVLKVAKTVAMPYYAQGLMDRRLFAQVVSTVTREYFNKKKTFDDTEKKAFEKDVNDFCLARVAEALKKSDYARVIEDMEQRVKDVQEEKREVEERLQRSLEQFENTKDEIFKLKTEKRDVVLASFRRLTKAGLAKTYWERWLTYKIEMNEAELRKKAQDEVEKLHIRVKQLEKELAQLTTISTKNAQDAKEAKSLSNKLVLVNSCLRTVKMQSFLTYLSKIKNSEWERRCWELQKMVDHCPMCENRPLEHERTIARLSQAYNMIDDAQVLIKDKDKAIDEQRLRANKLEEELNKTLTALQEKTKECQYQEQLNAERKDIFESMKIQVEAMHEKENIRNSEMRFLEDELLHARAELEKAQRTVRNMVPKEEGLAPFFVQEANNAATRLMDISEDSRLRKMYDSQSGRPFARKRTGYGGDQEPTRMGAFIDSAYRPAGLMPNPQPVASNDMHQSPPPSPRGLTSALLEPPPSETCPKCGLRLHLAPFCSRDGQRHSQPKPVDNQNGTPRRDPREMLIAQQTAIQPPVVRPNPNVSMPALQLERDMVLPKSPADMQELSAYMRDTRVAAMRRQPDWHTRDQTTQPGQKMGSLWNNVFTLTDVQTGAFGLPTKVADPLFGVYTKDQALGIGAMATPLHTSLDQQKQTPSFAKRV